MEKQILELAKRLIAVNSTKDEPNGLKEVLAIAKKDLTGFSVKEYESNGVPSLIFYNSKSLPKKFKLILDAHLDVVPGKPGQYSPKVVGDKLYGRGAYDMKAAAAAEILLFKEIAAKINYSLGLQLVTDEEIGGFNGAKYQAKNGVDAECMAVGECSSDFTLSISSKGVIWMAITFRGTASHAAYLWEGKNAVYEMNRFLSKLWKNYPIPKQKVWETTVNVSMVNTTNTTGNKVPGDARVQLDIRYIPGENEKTIKKIKSMLPKIAKVEILEYEPALNTPEDNTYVQRFLDIARKTLGNKIAIVGKNGASDLRHYPKTAGLEFGPIGMGPHTDNEWVSIKSLDVYYQILKTFLVSLNR